MSGNSAAVTDPPDLPSGATLDQVVAYLQALQVQRRAREPLAAGGPLDKFVTRRELVGLNVLDYRGGSSFGVGTLAGGGSGVVGGSGGAPDLSPPNTISGLTVTAGLTHFFVEFDPPTYTQGGGNAYTSIYAANYAGTGPLPTFSDAVEVYQVTGAATIAVIPAQPDQETHFWAGAVTVAGVRQVNGAGPSGGLNGVSATSGQDVTSLLNALTEAAEDVSSPYSKIAFRADLFYIGNAAGTFDGVPFYVTTTSFVQNGVTVPPGVYMQNAFMANGTITNAMIGNLQVDNAKIASLSAAKLTAGSIAVGETIQSTGFVAGTSGWRIAGNGTAEFSFAMVRGQLVAGQIAAGYVVASMVDSRGLDIKDASGNVILSAGTALANQITAGGGNLYKNTDFVLQSGNIPTYFAPYNNGLQPISYLVGTTAGAVGSAGYWSLTMGADATGSLGFFLSGGWSGWQNNVDYVWSFYAKASSGCNSLGFGFSDSWNHAPASVTFLQNPPLSTAWQRYVVLVNFGSNTIDPNGFITVNVAHLPKNGDTVFFSCMQLETGTQPSGWAPLAYVDPSGALQGMPGGTLLTSSIADKLSKSAPSILSSTVSINATSGAGFVAGTLTWNSAGVPTGGHGVAMTPGGLVGRNTSGVTTFSIDATTGDAFFAGRLQAGVASTGTILGSAVSTSTNASSVIRITSSVMSLMSFTTSGGDVMVTVNCNAAVMCNTNTPCQMQLYVLLDGSLYGALLDAPQAEFTLTNSNPMKLAAATGATPYNWGATQNFDFTFIIPAASIPAGSHTIGCQVDCHFWDASGVGNLITGTSLYARATAALREFLA